MLVKYNNCCFLCVLCTYDSPVERRIGDCVLTVSDTGMTVTFAGKRELLHFWEQYAERSGEQSWTLCSGI